MSTLIIKDALIVSDHRQITADVKIVDQRIAQIDGDIPAPGKARVLDAKGRVLIPGMIDDQVHFREPGLTHKGDIASESAAAVAGGITSFMDMPNVKPPTLTLDALARRYATAAKRAHANYAFYLGASNDNIEEIRRLDASQACGIKIFMGASTGNMLVDNRDTLAKIFSDATLLVAVHCEDTPRIKAKEARAREQFGNEVPWEQHPLIRDAEACYRSSSLAVDMAMRFGTRLHVLHLTTARELDLFEAGPSRDKHITAEVCAHHLYFSDADYARLGSLIKCNPAIKSESDRQALMQAVVSGKIDIIATDHAPHTLAEKQQNYWQAPSGLPLVQHALQILMEHVENGALTLEQVVNHCAHAPAEVFAVRDRGFIREGYFADLVLLDRNAPQQVDERNIRYKCGWSPFAGHTFSTSVATTLINGEIVYDGSQVIARHNAMALDCTGRAQ